MAKKRTHAAASANARLAKVMSHPLRFRILEALNQGEASPSDLARALDEPLGNTSYHVKVLEDCGAVELVGTQPVRGALEHIYRATARPYIEDDHWATLPVSVRRQVFDSILQGAWEHIVEAAGAGGLDDPQTHITWTKLELDDQGYGAIADLLNATLERALEIKAESMGRLVALPEEEREARTTELTIFHYDRVPSQRSRATKKARRNTTVRS